MYWESFFAECLFHTHEEVLPFVLQDILPILTNHLCSKEDNEFVIVLFDCLLTLLTKSNRSSTLVQVVSDGLTFMYEHFVDKNLQVHFIKTIIDIVFEKCFKKNHCNIWLNGLQLKAEGDSTAHDGSSPLKELICYIEALIKLFMEVWKETCNWSFDAEDDIEQMDCDKWHPLHHWIIKIYAILGFIKNDTKSNNLQDSRMSLFYNGLTRYVETFATISENNWLHNLQKGLIANWNDVNQLEDETIDISDANKILIFTNVSLKEQFLDAVWRVGHNLEGSVDCLNWLLTTEELFDNPLWIACIKSNVSKINAHKEQAVKMIDILCIQRQIIENVNECDSNLFDVLKELIIDIFNDLPIMDQEEILEYGFRMSLLSALDINCDSVFFNPNHQEHDQKKLKDELQVLLNKLVDSSVSDFRRQVEKIKEMALLSPHITLYRVLEAGVQYGQTHTIIKIFEELSILCSLYVSDTEKPMICEILESIARGLQNKQEENNFIKLVKMLLGVNRNVKLLAGKTQPLLDTSNLVSSCILPYMNPHGNNKPTKFALKLLKSTMDTFDVNSQTAKAFGLHYLIPLILALCKLLDGCKVHWEEMSPSLPLADVAELRNLGLINIEMSINVIHSIFQSVPTVLVHSLQWLNNSLKSLDWTITLHVNTLLDILPIKPHYIPKSVIEFCNLPPEHWSAHKDYHDYNVVDGLFECCAVSDPLSCQVIDALNNKELTSVDDISLRDVIRKLCQIMTYFTWSEMSRILTLCKILIQKGQIPLESFHDIKKPMLRSSGLPTTLNGILGMSRILLQVFQLLMSTSTSLTTVIQTNVIKLYVSTIKEMCWELVIDPGLDKNLSGDVISHIFDDLSQVICIVALENTDPLFILAMDVASMVSGHHAMNLKQSVTMVPESVYKELLLQKLDMRILAP